MTKPRAEIYDPSKVGTFHCTSRCVRRAFLCGFDVVTTTSFEHRHEWIRQRLLFLVNIFSIEVIAYAVMSNHLHNLLRTRPDRAKLWSDYEVARRWRLLFPLRYENGKPAEPSAEEIQALTLNFDQAEALRARLSDMSWFNRCLKEYIACAANLEDKCTGCFWEGRFQKKKWTDLQRPEGTFAAKITRKLIVTARGLKLYAVAYGGVLDPPRSSSILQGGAFYLF